MRSGLLVSFVFPPALMLVELLFVHHLEFLGAVLHSLRPQDAGLAHVSEFAFRHSTAFKSPL